MNFSLPPPGEDRLIPNQFDTRISEILRAAPIPPDLRASLALAELRASEPQRRSGSRRLAWIAAAAVLVIAGTVYGASEYVDRSRFAAERDFRSAMARYIASVEFKLDYKTNSLSPILQYLNTDRSISTNEIPEALLRRIPKGCKEIEWGPSTVTLICFHEAKPGGRLVHLFLIEKKGLTSAAIAAAMGPLRRFSRDTVGWETANHTCILVAGDCEMQIDHLVGDPLG